MGAKRVACSMTALFLVLAFLAGCAPRLTPTATPVPPTATSIPPTNTPMPPTHAAVPPTATSELADELPTWDYVVLGCTMAVWRPGFADPYAAHIESDLGVKVKVHRVASWDSASFLNKLRTAKGLRDVLREAEVVTFHPGVADLFEPQVGRYKSGLCGGEDNLDCFREAVKAFPENFDAIIGELRALCAPDTIIRTSTLLDSFYQQHALGTQDDLSPFYKAISDYIIKAASPNNIPVADVYLAFNGPDGQDDPNAKGYIQPDYSHVSKEGYVVITRLLHELGYEPIGR